MPGKKRTFIETKTKGYSSKDLLIISINLNMSLSELAVALEVSKWQLNQYLYYEEVPTKVIREKISKLLKKANSKIPAKKHQQFVDVDPMMQSARKYLDEYLKEKDVPLHY